MAQGEPPPTYPQQPYAPPGYGQPAYPPQAYGQYGQPGYYGQPYAQPAYYPGGYAPGYLMPVYAPQQDDGSTAAVAGVFWILCLLRNLLMMAGGAFIAMLAGPTLGVPGIAFLVFPLIGVVGCALAAYCDFARKSHNLGTAGAVVALVGSSFPGFLGFFGPIGFILALIGLLLHLGAKRQFKTA